MFELSEDDLILKLSDIEHLLLNSKLEYVEYNQIGFKGDNLNIEKRGENCVCCKGEKYKKCDPNFYGILVMGVSNPKNKKYRMIDGKHRLEKLMSLGFDKSLFYVLSLNEIQSFFKKAKGE